MWFGGHFCDQNWRWREAVSAPPRHTTATVIFTTFLCGFVGGWRDGWLGLANGAAREPLDGDERRALQGTVALAIQRTNMHLPNKPTLYYCNSSETSRARALLHRAIVGNKNGHQTTPTHI